uniref:Hypothetical chloroplast RF1 n=1 Tax=Chaetophoropsis cf. attenuata FACHB-2291 TaxID=2725790 RepID=A0A6H1U7J8_9CHLO|nr:hypothetical chloroplast RF1 [Chaetophoropsis cf. attenuata FACHB-2291]
MTFFYLVKDYIEVVHKLVETSPSHVLQHSTYTDSLTIISFGLSSFKQLCLNFLSFEWLKQLWYFPIIVPEIATSMMEEISVLDGNFHNILTVLDKPIAVGNEVYGNYYLPLTCFEKIFTGLINSLFIWLPTSTATFICFRRFIMQGVEAGYSAALGTMAASLFWLTSIIFGLRFIVVPWMSLDLFRYWLGFLLLMKYFWDNRYAYKEVKHNSVFGKQTRRNIFAFHFLLALTEQTSLYPFLSNFSISSQSTLLEGFPSENIFDFTLIHVSYLLGIAIGSYSLINLLSWFWQDPAYRFYFWIMNKFKKLRVADIVRPVHLFFQSITVLFAFSSLPYFGIEYQVTNPLGFLPNDQVFHQFKKTSFLTHSTSPAYYRSRLNFPRQKFFRYEDWAEYYHKNTPIDTSLYDQGAYRLYTMEDLSYGKDYEWMRRRSDKIKIRSRLKRLRWFPRNWANRLWEFTKTWSRRNVLWRNDILNMYQYSWDSKAPIIWNKLVFEEFFPGQKSERVIQGGPKDQVIKTHELTAIKKSNTENKSVSNTSDVKNDTPLGKEDQQSNKEDFLTPNKSISKSWDSFWGPDPDWTTKFLSNQQSLTKTDIGAYSSKIIPNKIGNILQPSFDLNKNRDDFYSDQKSNLNYLSRFNVSDNDVWWKWLSHKNDSKFSSWDFSSDVNRQTNLFEKNQNIHLSKKTQKQDFWEPQNRLISVYSENTNFQKQELNLEFSTLRKFVRKLTARFKVANINKVSEQFDNKPIWIGKESFFSPRSGPFNNKTNNFSSNSLKTLLITPSLRDWTVFQTLLANINSVVWWRRFSNFQAQSEQNCSGSCPDLQKTPKLSAIQGLSQGDLAFNTKTKLNKFLKTAESFTSEPNFEKIQNKYFEIQNRKKFLMFNTPLTDSISKSELSSNRLATTFKFLKPNRRVNLGNTYKNTINLRNNNFLVFLNKNNLNTMKFDLPSLDSSPKLLHPVKYYLHKEQTFKRKLSFYGVRNSRSSTVSNTSFVPDRTFPKTQKILGEIKSANVLSETFLSDQKINDFVEPVLPVSKNLLLKNHRFFSQLGSGKTTFSQPSPIFREEQQKLGPDQNLLFLKNKNKLPIFNFYLKTYFQTYKKTKLYVLNTKMKRQLGMGASARRKGRDYSNKLLKRAKILSNTPWIRQWIDQSGFLARRKRLETWIARQHYDQNELWAKIMKTDVDLFMKRQPSSYFLTTTEENLLHLRRFLLFEYYDTLRWYTYMTNYRSMKNTIGGTKSFTNKIYNQQFKGTFHKVRHLFALTPSVSNGSLLKFDRPLYNSVDSTQSSSSPYENGRYTSWTHEELKNSTNKAEIPRDLLEESSKNLQQSIWKNNLTYGSEKYSPNLLTKLLMTENSNNGFPLSNQVINIDLSQTSSQNEIIKTNLHRKLMMRILQLRKKQKWTIDYKRASEKLWKKWKLRSNIQEAKSIPILIPQFEDPTQKIMGSKIEKSVDSVSNDSQTLLNRKLLQSKKLKVFEARNIVSNSSTNNSSISFPKTSNLHISKINTLSQNSLLAKILKDKPENDRQLNLAQIFSQNIFTRKLIKDKYKKLVKNNVSFSKRDSVLGKLTFSQPKAELFSSLLSVGSFNIKLQKIINNRTLKLLKVSRNPIEGPMNFQAENSRVKNLEFLKQSNDLSAQNSIQLYEINKIRQERSNIQNFVFMKKFLVNENLSMFTRSQLRPLPGKRTKALYDKLSSANRGGSSRFNQYFLSAILDKDVKILFYKNRSAASKKIYDFYGKILSSQKYSRFLRNGISNRDELSKDFSTLSLLNSKWKFFVNTLRNSPELVSNKLDKTLQTKLLKDQNEKILTTDFSQQLEIPHAASSGSGKTYGLGKLKFSQNPEPEPQGFFDITNSLQDSAGVKNVAIQKLTKTLLSKQKNLNSLEKPTTNRITKSGRKRQQDFVTRSLLKRHLNLKSRRKLFLKTKEINNQRMVLDRKYEIQERVFLNQIGFLSDVKTGLEKPLSSEMSLNTENDLNLTFKNLVKNNTGVIQSSQNSELAWQKSERFLGGVAKNSVLNFLRWLTISKNLEKNVTSRNIFENKQESLRSDFPLSKSEGELLGSNRWSASGLASQTFNSKFAIKQSYLSSTKRSTLFIDKILTQHKNDSTQNYLNYKLNQHFSTSSKVENEKSSLRRSLRKFSLGTYVSKSETDLRGNKSDLLKKSKMGRFGFWENVSGWENFRTGKTKVFPEPRTSHSDFLSHFFSRNNLQIDANTRTETSFINNLLLKNWLIRKSSIGYAKTKREEDGSSFSFDSRNQSLLEKVNKKAESGLINFNKYIIFARTNQNKLSRQQIRKKLKKRRIIRMKRAERLKTLKDHPLKFRSDQIQTFYNIRHSLKKWKDFSFISDKNKFMNSDTNRFDFSNWKETPTNLIPPYESSSQLSSINSNTGFQKLRYKPLNFLQTEKPALYKDIFITSLPVEITKPTFVGEPETKIKPLFINTTNMPFYAGWDESLRKFVLTNRLLNRREAGYQSSNIFRRDTNETSLNPMVMEVDQKSVDNENNIVFSLWPLRGTNSATTLFSQFPFMTAPQTNFTYSQELIRSIKSGTKYDLQTSMNLNKLSNQTINNSEKNGLTFDKKWKQKYTLEARNDQVEQNFSDPNRFVKSMGNTASYLHFKEMNRIKSFIKSSKNDDQLGIRQSGQVISNLANATTRKMARHALFAGRSGLPAFRKLKVFNQKEQQSSPLTKLFFSRINSHSKYSKMLNPDQIDKKLSTKILLLRNLRQGNRAQTKLAYIRRLQKTLRPTGSSWKTTQVLTRRKKQRIKQNNVWGMPQNEASTRFSVRKRKKRGNNKNPRLRGDKNYKKTKRQYRQKLYLRPKNKPLRRRSLGVTFKNKLNYWRRNYQNLDFKNISSSKDLKRKYENSFQMTSENSEARPIVRQISQDQTTAFSFYQNLKDNSRYSQRNKEWKFLNNFVEQSSGTRRPRQLYRSLFKNPTVQAPILYATLPGHSRSIPLIKNLPLPGSSVKTLNRVIKWSSADGASRFYRVNLSYGWAMTLFLNNLRQKVNSQNRLSKSFFRSDNSGQQPESSSVNSLITKYLTELETTNQTKFSSSREFKRRFYKLRQLSYTMSLRLYDRWFFYYYKNANSNLQKGNLLEVPENRNLALDQNLETNINTKIKESIVNSSAMNTVEETLSPFKHIKNFLTFHISFSRKEKELENQSNFRSYLKNLRNTAYSKARNRETDNKQQVVQNTNIGDENNKSSKERTLSVLPAEALNSVSNLENTKLTEFSGLENFKLFSMENKDSENSSLTNFTQGNLLVSDKKENQVSPRNLVKSNKTLLKKEKKYAEDRFFFAQFNKPPLVDDYRLTLENNRHYPLNGGFVWPGDYLRLQTILLPKEMKDLYLFKKTTTNTNNQFLKDKKNE